MIEVFNTYEDLSRAAAKLFADLSKQSIHSHGYFNVALSGGNTPRHLYELLAAKPYCDRIDWNRVHVFWGDERCVPPQDERSNFRMANETFLEHVSIPAVNIHAINGDLPPAQAAAQYDTFLHQFFGGQPPVFDLILLGLGSNAHTASLFPHTPVLDETKRLVAEVYIQELDMYRITFTAALINQAQQVVFLVSGIEKAIALHNVLEGPYQPRDYPAQLIHPQGVHPTWLVDRAAAHKISISVSESTVKPKGE